MHSLHGVHPIQIDSWGKRAFQPCLQTYNPDFHPSYIISNNGSYTYVDLVASQEIRLCQLQPSRFGDALEVHLQHWPLRVCPAYTALSCVWKIRTIEDRSPGLEHAPLSLQTCSMLFSTTAVKKRLSRYGSMPFVSTKPNLTS